MIRRNLKARNRLQKSTVNAGHISHVPSIVSYACCGIAFTDRKFLFHAFIAYILFHLERTDFKYSYTAHA